MTTAVDPRAPARAVRALQALPRSDRAVVAALTILALALRLPNIGRAFWIDEAVTIGISSHHLTQIPGLLAQDGAPPLFYVLVHFWVGWFGSSAVAAHTLPLLFSLACVPAGYWAGRELFDRRAGIATAALMATSPFLAWYATETRMYTLVVLLATLGTTFAWRAVRDRRTVDAIGAVACADALLYTHNWCPYLVAATGGVILGHALQRRDAALQRGVLIAGGAATLVWLPWVPTLLEQAANTAAPWAVQPGIGDFFADPSTVLGGTIGVVVVPLLAAGVWVTRREVPLGTRRSSGLIAGTALLVTAVGFVGAELEPSWTVRYLAVIAAPYLIAVAGWLAASAPGRRFLWATGSLLAVWSVIGSLLPDPGNRYAKDNMEAVAAEVRPMLTAGDAVIVTETEQTPVAHLYLPPGLLYLDPMGPVGDPGVVDWRHIVARLDTATPCAALSPTLDALPVGARIVEIDPYRTIGAPGSAWSKAVNGQVRADDAFLAADPSLREIGAYRPALDPRPYSPVSAVLWQKVSRTPACS